MKASEARAMSENSEAALSDAIVGDIYNQIKGTAMYGGSKIYYYLPFTDQMKEKLEADGYKVELSFARNGEVCTIISW